MAAATTMLQAQNPNELEAMINGYIAQGFVVANRSQTSVTLVKRKVFSVLWAVVGFIVCLLPLLVYLIVYATQSDQMVMITLSNAMPQGSQLTGSASIPLNAARSPDGNYWWDGQAWQPINGGSVPPSYNQ